MKNVKVSPAMFDVLSVIVAHDRNNRGADPDLYPTGTVLALVHRGLIRRMIDGSVRPTAEGIRIGGRS